MNIDWNWYSIDVWYDCKNHNTVFFLISEAESTPPITYIFWHAKHFQHFHYLYKLTRDCENRVQKLKQSKDQANRMPENVAIKIGIVGHFTADNVKLISKKSGSVLALHTRIIKYNPTLRLLRYSVSV